MLNQLVAGAATIVTGMVSFAGVASAEGGSVARDYDADFDAGNEQVGLVNVNDLEVLHDANLSAGLCDNNVSVFVVQVPIEEVANGIGVPVGSPGDSEAIGLTPENCAAGSLLNGGTVQGN